MAANIEALRVLHRIHIQLTDLRSRMDRGPIQLNAAAANVQRLKDCCEAAREALVRGKVAADEKQLHLQEREARIEKHQTNLNKAGTNKEYQAIQEQIAADNQANSVLGDEILEALEKIDELDAQVNAANSELAQGEQEEQRVQQTVRDATPLLEADLARLTGELNENKSQLPEDFRSEFDRISEARGEDALAPMDGETCGACYQTLNPQTVNKLLLDQLVFCPSCGCLLYLAEDRSVGAG